MASASDARVGKVKVNSSIMAAALASGMDLSGFRIGKQRLISKMKKKTSLKKVILEEREYNKAKGSGLDPGAATLAAGIGGFDAEASNLSLDAPDFVPGWGENDAEKESDGSADTSESGSEAGTDSDPDPNDDDDDDDALVEEASEEPLLHKSAASSAAPSTGPDLGDADAEGRKKPGVGVAAILEDEDIEKEENDDVDKKDDATLREGAGPEGQKKKKRKPRNKKKGELKNPDGIEQDKEQEEESAAVAAAAQDGSAFMPSWCRPDAMVEGNDPPASAEEKVSHLQHREDEDDSEQELHQARQAALARLQESDVKKGSKKQPGKPAQIEVRSYVHQVLSDDLDEKVKFVLSELARYQERAKERDPMKYQKQKRLCVGLREAQRNVARGKAKAIVCAPNLEECAAEGGLDDTVEDLIEACREHDVPVVFALSRNRIGKALGRNIRLSIVCLLSLEGAHVEWRAVLKLTEELRRQWVLRHMANITLEEAELARQKAQEKADRDALRREAKERLAAEKKAEEERKRAEAKAAKEAEKARRQAAHQAEMERRKKIKAAKEIAAAQAASAAEAAAAQAAAAEAAAARQRKLEEEKQAAETAARQKAAAAQAAQQSKAAAAAAKSQAAKTAANLAGASTAKVGAATAASAAKPGPTTTTTPATSGATKAPQQQQQKKMLDDNDDEDGSGSGSDSDSSGSSVPLGFNASLF